MATEIKEYTQWVSPHVASTPTPLLINTIRLVLREVCERTGTWRHVAEIPTVVGQAEYAIPTPSGTEVSAIMQCTERDKQTNRITPAKFEEAMQKFTGWPLVNTPENLGAPAHIVTLNDNKVLFAPIPDDVYNLVLMVTLLPTTQAPDVPDDVYSRTIDAVMYGSVARLASMPDKPWSNNNTARYNLALYHSQLTKLQANANIGQNRVGTRLRAPVFA